MFSIPCNFIAYQAAFETLLHRSSIESWFPFGKTIIQEWVLLHALFVPFLKTSVRPGDHLIFPQCAMSAISEKVINTDRQSSFVLIADRKGLRSSYRKQLRDILSDLSEQTNREHIRDPSEITDLAIFPSGDSVIVFFLLLFLFCLFLLVSLSCFNIERTPGGKRGQSD